MINQGALQPTIASLGTPNPVTITNAPNIRIVSVAGINTPAMTNGTFVSAADIVVPNTQANPVTVVVEGIMDLKEEDKDLIFMMNGIRHLPLLRPHLLRLL